MDDTLKVEFPMGDLKIVVSEPTEGQLFALALSRTSKDADRVRLVQRLVRVLEALTGPEQWYGIIEDALISGTMDPEAVVQLASDVFNFDWKAHRKPADTPETVTIDHAPTGVSVTGPRVVSGG